MADTTKVEKNLKQLITKGKKQGYLTYEELNDALPEGRVSPEQIDQMIMVFDELDIEVVDGTKIKVFKPGVGKKVTKEGAAAPEPERDVFGRVTDPVKMYLREMGLVSLLSREDEVVIAKQIEVGEQEVADDGRGRGSERRVHAQQHHAHALARHGGAQHVAGADQGEDERAHGAEHAGVDMLGDKIVGSQFLNPGNSLFQMPDNFFFAVTNRCNG